MKYLAISSLMVFLFGCASKENVETTQSPVENSSYMAPASTEPSSTDTYTGVSESDAETAAPVKEERKKSKKKKSKRRK